MDITPTRSRTDSDATPPLHRTSPSNGSRPSSAPSSRKLPTNPAALLSFHPLSSAKRPATSSPLPRRTSSTTPPIADPPTSSTPSSAPFDPTPSPTTTTPAPITAPLPPPTSTLASPVSRTRVAVDSATRSTSYVPSATLQAALLLLLAATNLAPTFPSALSGVILSLLPSALPPLLLLMCRVPLRALLVPLLARLVSTRPL